MNFPEKYIEITPEDRKLIGLSNDCSLFPRKELPALQRTVNHLFEAEFNEEFDLFEDMRLEFGCPAEALDHGLYNTFRTHHLGEMVLKLDRVAEAQ